MLLGFIFLEGAGRMAGVTAETERMLEDMFSGGGAGEKTAQRGADKPLAVGARPAEFERAVPKAARGGGLGEGRGGMRRPWTAEEEAQALRLRGEGKTYRVIAETLGRTGSAVLSKLSRCGVTCQEVNSRRPEAGSAPADVPTAGNAAGGEVLEMTSRLEDADLRGALLFRIGGAVFETLADLWMGGVRDAAGRRDMRVLVDMLADVWGEEQSVLGV
jgi:hypothetical protein